MLYQKHIIIAIAVLAIAGGLWLAGTSAPAPIETQQPSAVSTDSTSSSQAHLGQVTTTEPTATSTSSGQATTTPKPAPARIQFAGTTDFKFDIVQGQTLCGTKIGTVEIVSSDPSRELYWGFTGAKPIWLTFSEVEGKTPAKVDMTFNCILSGAEDAIDWTFTVVEKTKEGKWVDGYYRSFSLKGDIR